MIKNNGRLVDYLCTTFFKRKNLSVLEIGSGKGYFKDTVKSKGGVMEYYAVDRNENILSNLKIDSKYTICAELPNIKNKILKKFDIVFVGYVIEHLSCGIDLYNAIEDIKSLLKDDGILVLLFPNSMKLGMEFYNIDYTHIFPTTKRNVNQVIRDNSMYVEKAIDLCGILYPKKVDSKISYNIKNGIMFLYSYKIMSVLAKFFYCVPLWELTNVFWRIYGLLKEPNVMFIAKKSSNKSV